MPDIIRTRKKNVDFPVAGRSVQPTPEYVRVRWEIFWAVDSKIQIQKRICLWFLCWRIWIMCLSVLLNNRATILYFAWLVDWFCSCTHISGKMKALAIWWHLRLWSPSLYLRTSYFPCWACCCTFTNISAT